MKKNLLLLIVGLMLALVLLSGCKDEPRPTLPPASDNGGDTSTPAGDNNNGGGTDNYPTSETEVFLSSNSTTAYKLYSTLSTEYTTRFQTSFKNKTGATLELTDDINTERLIILATGDKFASVEGANIYATYTGCQVKVVGEKVCIAVTDSLSQKILNKVFPMATNMLFSNMTKSGNDWKLAKAFDQADDYTGVDEIVPVHDKTAMQYIEGFYETTTDGKIAYQVGYKSADKAEDSIDAYGQKLLSMGYKLHDTNSINGNKFATYVNEEETMSIHLNWFKSKKLFRIIYGRVEYLPETQPVTGYQKVATPTLSMLQLDPASPGGLSMVAQLEDGSFIIIDGGIKKEIHKTRLYNFLYQNKPASDAKPRVTWIFTHPHGDHVANAIDFLSTKASSIDLELVIYNFPDLDADSLFVSTTGAAHSKNLYNTITKNFPNTPIYVPHAGEQLFFPGLEMEVFYTQEEMFKVGVKNENDTCLVFKLKFNTTQGTKTCMVFGDSTNTQSSYGYALYGNALKSDIMQVPHHGAGTASWELYEAVDASICLWSVESAKFYDDGANGHRTGCCELSKTHFLYNWKLRNAEGVAHYHHSQIVTINMTTLSVTTKVVA